MLQLPKINASYWLQMLLCTTMGELGGNLISRNLAMGYTQGAAIDVAILSMAVLLFIYKPLHNFIPYWLLILFGNIGGTNLADWVTLPPLPNDKKWGILQPLEMGTAHGSLAVMVALCIVLIGIFMLNKYNNKKDYISTILYWLAILLSSTFGTTSGDFITNDTPLGALGGSVVLLLLILCMYILYQWQIINKTIAYWLVLVLMHPIGATIGNYISKPIGLNLGNIITNIVLMAIFILLYLQQSTTQPKT